MTGTICDVSVWPAHAGAGTGGAVDVRSLDDQSVLDAMRGARAVADRAEAGLLRFAVHYVDLHPVTEEHPAATPGDRDRCLHEHEGTAVVGAATGLGLGGPGTPAIGEHAVEALGAHLSLSYPASYGLLSDAVELCYRLPRLWDLVQAGRLQAWKARQVTVHTRSVSTAVAEFVDRQLAWAAARNRVPTLARLRALTHEALLQCDPDTATGREEAALAARDVTLDHEDAASTGVSTLTATLDTLDALDLHDTVTEMAATMGRLGDTSPVGVRRAHALGMLARPDRVLDLFDHHPGDHPGAPSDDGASGATDGQDAGGQEAGLTHPFTRTTATLFVHVDAGDLRTGPDSGVGSIEKLGAATLALIRGWLSRTSHVTVRPVLHPHRSRPGWGYPGTGTVAHSPAASTTPAPDSRRGTEDVTPLDPCCAPVDRHDPPAAMREAVVLRDGHCVFPACTVDARSCDLDHIVAYLDPDDGGPPGQTRPRNLGCLCRRHHRLKTFAGWDYRLMLDGDYAWTSPAGRTYVASATPKTAPQLG